MKPIYQMFAYYCKLLRALRLGGPHPRGEAAQGRRAPVKCCGKCGGHKFEARKAA
jgi:hypothetical protein